MGGVLISEFEKMTSQNNLRPIKKKSMVNGVNLLVAEGYREADQNMPENHWLMTWALTRDEHVVELQKVMIPSYGRMPNSGIEFATRRRDRIEVCERAAQKWVDNALEAGWI